MAFCWGTGTFVQAVYNCALAFTSFSRWAERSAEGKAPSALGHFQCTHLTPGTSSAFSVPQCTQLLLSSLISSREDFSSFSSQAFCAPLCTSTTTLQRWLEFVGLPYSFFKECPSAFTSPLLLEPRIRAPRGECGLPSSHHH